MRRVLAPLSLLTALLLAGCAGGTGEPETIVVTSTEVVDAPAPESAPEAEPAPAPEPEAAPAPEQPAAPLAGAFELDPAYKGQVGGTCGSTAEGYSIRVGGSTSCDFAAALYPQALAATYSMTQNPETVSIPKAELYGVVSPVTGQGYDLTCIVGSDLQHLSCSGPGNSDPRVMYGDPARQWRNKITIL
ncbi:hypothetical protein HMPREF2785_02380 [Corynebacterium sp. HMSC067D03]|uniref:hypothetical protein n=1 Tax=unclassified Corynebacterium TaxID=2624378 RepID=UPI0008A5640B|nr:MULTISPECIES: hypothetical protein [unclassified Corynebacterium]OFL17526.1 hypothetical protein HMPREF2785_02380 [Corynebacterium sp. HMSC067D03]OHO34859.1 hypothetical protein HMPREF2690_02795 [Corynebacterium sp. HMSC034E11]